MILAVVAEAGRTGIDDVSAGRNAEKFDVESQTQGSFTFFPEAARLLTAKCDIIASS